MERGLAQGVVYLNATTWSCTRYIYTFSFVSRNNLKSHFQSVQHLSKLVHAIGQKTRQKTL
jgi:hypothetical protein